MTTTLETIAPDISRGLFDAMQREADMGLLIEPLFDSITQDWLRQSAHDLNRQCQRGGLLEATSFGRRLPWLWCLQFRTRGLQRREDGEVVTAERHVVAVRFLPDFLRRANKFEMLTFVVESGQPPVFHPNVAPNGTAICLEVYSGESLVEIALSLHDLIRGRITFVDERDALNHEACAYWRNHVAGVLDDRPLFGSPRRWQVQLS